MGSKFNDLPEDLLMTIFLLHPVKTLALLRTVCTLWARIITSKSFVQLFLSQQRTSSNTNKHFLLQNASKSTGLMDIETRRYQKIFGENYECYGVCDGLFCLSSTKDHLEAHSKILLWTPIFRGKLPPLRIRYSKHTHLLFGYHNGDYKVLKLLIFPRIFYVCIYSLSTDEWEVLEYDNLVSSTFNRLCSKARLVDGSAYIVKDSKKSERGILSFDLSSETFRETKLPADLWYSDDFIMEEYMESLALIGNVMKENKLHVVMWVLRVSDDNSFSWDEIKLGISLDIYQVMGFVKKDELVMGRSSTFLYNIVNKSQQWCRLDDRLGHHSEIRRYMMKPIYSPIRQKVASTTSYYNKYNVLADSDEDL
ncbi:putative F-box protein At5g52610 [Daucus carota subsp. sativus]|uniref:putative F-box protein At5g52610 n=1 Tax=Daucus carota subsp. sativus TaxID=79200 RepID=UPI0007EF5640|nr:PREDICTED: putative F-box protein At5g52610 [Daucus carota subsp. sativus]